MLAPRFRTRRDITRPRPPQAPRGRLAVAELESRDCPTPFTFTSPTSGGQLPAGATQVGGVVLDLIGTNGVRVVSQAPASSLFQGFYNNGTPTAYQGNPGIIGIQGGFTPAVINALGGGLAELAVRITLFDGDTGPGNFDDNANLLTLNGVTVGNFSDVVTQETNATGTTAITDNPGGGFRNETLDTGFFFTTNPAVLTSFYATLSGAGQVTYRLLDTAAPFDNFFDFRRGVDGGLVDVGQPPNVRPIAVNDAASTPLNTPVAINVLANDSDPDGTLNAGTVSVVTGPSNGSVSVNPTTGVITYTPNAGFSGTNTFTYTVADNLGAVSNVATVTVTVQPPVTVTDVRVQFGTQSFSLLGNTRNLPWTTISALDVVFSADVAVDAADLTLSGVNVATYGGTFSYTPTTRTARLTFAAPLGRDRLTLRVDGDGPGPDGNTGVNLSGGDYTLGGINVLPGDFNNDGVVTISDSTAVRTAATVAYSQFADLDGDGDVDLADANAPRQGRLGTTLPPLPALP